MSLFFSLAFVAAVLRIGAPYALAALGGTLSERSGVINIALEGMLLAGAFAATIGAYYTGSYAAGVLAGAAGGVLLASIYALAVVGFGADQIVCGLAANLLADGATRFLLKENFGSASNSPRIAAFARFGAAGLWAALTNPLVVGAVVLVFAAHQMFRRTPVGLRLRAVGEHPEAAASVGVRVRRIRWMAVLLSGALAGLGGAYLAADQRQFVGGMSGGRGYIALAAMIFARWRPVPAALAGLGFGLAEALEVTLQASGIGVPGWAVQMLPYLLTIVALAGFMGRAVPPRALGRPFEDSPGR